MHSRVSAGVRAALCGGGAVALLAFAAPPSVAPTTPFASLVDRLSEAGGDFGGDNLISNEQSYLRVLPALDRAHVSGGAYVGVGPDQNFSYIAAIKPDVAFIIDIRRDNLLLQLLFKAIFSLAPTRGDYLAWLAGRPAPLSPLPIDRLAAFIDGSPALSAAALGDRQTRIHAVLAATGVTLSKADLDRIDEFHRAFIASGLSIVFQARGQPPRAYYPTLRALLLETDGEGRTRSFLASDDGYATVRSLEMRDLVVPVVGDVSGPKAMRAIAAEIRARHDVLSAFYISNVEFYLFQNGTFPAWIDNLTRFPIDDRSTIVRSVFPSGYRGVLPQSVPGHYSTSLVQPARATLARIYTSYLDLVLATAGK